ncbi:Tetratricopeptide repeat protein 5, partial [Saguinus oedipus]
MANEKEEVRQILQKQQELVDQLYSFQDCNFKTRSVENAGGKQQDVQEEMQKSLKEMLKTLWQTEEVVGLIQGK